MNGFSNIDLVTSVDLSNVGTIANAALYFEFEISSTENVEFLTEEKLRANHKIPMNGYPIFNKRQLFLIKNLTK